MKEHPINRLLDISLDNVSRMVDVSKIVGQPIKVGEEQTIIPISKVTFGFGAGGSEFTTDNSVMYNEDTSEDIFPFGGGSGGGVSISPIGFVTLENGKLNMMNMETGESLIEKVITIVSNFIKPGKP